MLSICVAPEDLMLTFGNRCCGFGGDLYGALYFWEEILSDWI